MHHLALSLAILMGSAAALPAGDPTPTIQGHFDLRDSRTGQRVTQASYDGRYRLVFFGFTHCPMTCPLGLHTLGSILTHLGPDASKVKCLFITIDPTRDNAKVMSTYLANFDPRITGLVGSTAAIAAAMKSFRLEAQRTGAGENYGFEHPAIIYVMDPHGRYLKTLPSRGEGQKLAEEFRK